jgi:hypothetical protein
VWVADAHIASTIADDVLLIVAVTIGHRREVHDR